MPEIHSSKNILYNTGALRVEGNLHIGDIIYRNREELRYPSFISICSRMNNPAATALSFLSNAGIPEEAPCPLTCEGSACWRKPWRWRSPPACSSN